MEAKRKTKTGGVVEEETKAGEDDPDPVQEIESFGAGQEAQPENDLAIALQDATRAEARLDEGAVPRGEEEVGRLIEAVGEGALVPARAVVVGA